MKRSNHAITNLPATGAALLCSSLLPAALLAAPVPVSPGAPAAATRIEQRCPTFSWTRLTGASGYQLAVYAEAADGGWAGLLQRELPGSVASWTPALSDCGAWQGSLAWAIRAVTANGAQAWSPYAYFETPADPSGSVLREAHQLLQQGEAVARGQPASAAGRPLSAAPQRASAAAAVRGPARATSSATKPPGISLAALAGGEALRIDAGSNVEAVAFAGDGSGLTSLNPANLSPGTAAIDISGSAADIACSGCVTPDRLAFTPLAGSDLTAHAVIADAHHARTIVDAGNQLAYAGTTLNLQEGAGSGLDLDSLDGNDSTDILLKSELLVAQDQSCPPDWKMSGLDGAGNLLCNPPCGDGVVQPPEECDDGNDANGDGCSLVCRDEQKWVFLSSTAHNGNFGGIAGADAICQARATTAGLAGTYLAWISDPSGSPASRFKRATVPYLLVDAGHTKVADDWSDLTDGSLDHAIDIHEYGGLVEWGLVWTGTNTAGGYAANPWENCLSWTRTQEGIQWYGGFGYADPGNTTDNWTDSGTVWECNAGLRLYCFQQ